MGREIRVRFAPSPTGPLHIGGVRTALYNYCFARKHQGTFILRIEDTDHKRYVDKAEEYIINSLNWLGLSPDESVVNPGEYGPYRQSDRRDLYKEHVQKLIAAGHAYYAFDTSEDLEKMRADGQAKGIHSPKYDSSVRHTMKNSLTLSETKVEELLANGDNVTVRMKVPMDETIQFTDDIRGVVKFNSNELDDKVIMKADGLPTYHLANIVDDHLMEISHVIRGEEWLSSTAHHVLLYRSFGWEDSMPTFAHLPLILKPSGKGKLSKRDGAKFGFPVFPLEWFDAKDDQTYLGFKENGFLPEAVLNFLALLGWNPGTDEELFSLEQLCSQFSLPKINKSGAQFNYEKAKWFNQHYIKEKRPSEIISLLTDKFPVDQPKGKIEKIIEMLQPRVEVLSDFISQSSYFWSAPDSFDRKPLKKKFKSENASAFEALITELSSIETFEADTLSNLIKGYITNNELSFGAILPVLRIWITGSMAGPDLFEMMSVLGKGDTIKRLEYGLNHCQQGLHLSE